LQVQSAIFVLFAKESLFSGQKRQVLADGPEYVPPMQPTHGSEPVEFLNVPATHAVQLCPDPVWPALQEQLLMLLLPSLLNVSGGHSIHADCEVSLVPVENLPSGQKEQGAAP